MSPSSATQKRCPSGIGLLTCRHRASIGFLMIVALCIHEPLVRGVAAAHELNKTPDIAYRRIFVPSEKPDAWPLDGQKYLPIDSHDFEKLIASANDPARFSALSPRIIEATYSAKLEGTTLVGRGAWTIDSHEATPALLELGNSSLQLSAPKWADEAEAPVRWGVWARPEHSRLIKGLEVPRSATLEFSWEIPGRQSPAGIEIPLRLPAATITRLNLDLPQTMRPLLEGSIVTLSTTPTTDVAHYAADELGESTRRWNIAIDQSRQSLLRIVDSRPDSPRESPTWISRDTTSYAINNRGLDIVATFDLSTPTRDRRSLAITVPPDVRIMAAEVDGTAVSWQVTPGQRGLVARATVELPVANDAKLHRVKVRAWQPLTLDSPWTLPSLRAEDVFWTFGSIQLSIAPTLELRALVPTGCRHTRLATTTEAAEDSELWSFDAFSPAATVQMVVGKLQPEINVHQATELNVSDRDVTGRMVTKFKVSRGSVHKILADVSSSWSVEAVEVVPADALVAWRVDGRQQLELQLARAARADQPLTITVSGRLHRTELLEPLARNMLGVLRWRHANIVEDLVSINTLEPYIVEVAGGLREIAWDELSDDTRQRFVEVTSQNIYDLRNARADASIQLGLKRGNYESNVQVDATYVGPEVHYAYQVVCRPQDYPVDQLLVYFSEPLEKELRWNLDSSGTHVSAERIASSDPRTAELPDGGECWQLRLRRPTMKVVELRAETTQPTNQRTLVPLLLLPESNNHRARVHVHTRDGKSLIIRPQGISPAPLPIQAENAVTGSRSTRISAAYRYESANWQDAPSRPRLWLIASDEMADQGEPSRIVARWLKLDSLYSLTKRGVHRATFTLDNVDASHISLVLSRGARLISSTVDGQPAKTNASNDSLVSVELPSQARQVTLALFLESHEPRLAPGSELLPPLVADSFPVLAGEWSIQMPKEFGIDGANELNELRGLNWRERIFGFLGGQRGHNVFVPEQILRADWFLAESESPSTIPAVEAATKLSKESPGNVGTELSRVSPPAPHALESAGSNISELAPNEALLPQRDATSLPTGWHTFRVTMVNELPAALVVTHRSTTTAWAIAVFLAAIVGGRYLRRLNRTAFIAGIAAAACLALLLPTIWAPLATGAAFGLLISPLANWRISSIAHEATVTGGRVTTVLTAILIMVTAVATTVADGPATPESPFDNKRSESIVRPDQPRSAPTAIERVLIPVGKDRRPVGDKWFVSKPFLRKLLEWAEPEVAVTHQWLVRAAHLSGMVDGGMDQDGTARQSWTLSFRMEVFARDTMVKLPLRGDEAEWTSTASVDGIPAPVAWNSDGSLCEFLVREPGRYNVVFTFVPDVQVSEGKARIELTIPPLLDTAYSITHPSDIEDLRIDGAARFRRDEELDRTRGVLDHSGRFTVNWILDGSQSASAFRAEASELRLLQISPDGISLRWKLVADETSDRPEAVRVSLDRQWRQDDAEGSMAALPEKSPSSRRFIEVPFTERQTVDGNPRWEANLSLRLADSRALGQHHLPPVEVDSPHVATYRMALDVHESLECEPLEGTQWSSAEADEFLAAWGERGPILLSQLAVMDAAPSERISIGVRPRIAESQINEVLHVAAEHDCLAVQYQADVEPSDAHCYQYSLQVPAALVVDDVLVSRLGRPAPLRWVRLSDDQVNVFFDQPLKEAYRLVLTGRVSKQVGLGYALPRVTALSDESATQQVQLYRHEEIVLNVEGPAEQLATDTEAAQLPPLAWAARPAEVYRLDEKTSELFRLTVLPNTVKTAGETLTALTREEGAWWNTFRCRLTVEEGRLDRVRLRVPSTWIGPFENDLGAADVVVESLDDRQAVLTMHLPKPLSKGESLTFSLRGPLANRESEPISVPHIVPQWQGRFAEYLSVPRELDGQSAAWTRIAVEPAELPTDLPSNFAPTPSAESFRVVAQPFRVSLQPQSSDAKTATVRLADTTVIWGIGSGSFSKTQFVVVPQGLVLAEMTVPAEEELISVTLDDRPALLQPVGHATWQVQLGPPRLPQVLEVVTRNMEGTYSHSVPMEFGRPRLSSNGRPLSVELSLWSVRRPTTGSRAVVSGASAESVFDQMALRLERLVSIAETAIPTAIESGTPDSLDWFRPWAERLSRTRDKALRLLTDAQSTPIPERQISLLAAEKIQEIANRVDAWIAQGGETGLTREVDPRGAVRSTHAADGELDADELHGDWYHYIADGGADRLAIEFIPNGLAPAQARIVGVLSILAVAAGAVWLTRRPAACDIFWRCPHLMGVLAGLGYWAWLTPSWLGLLIAVGSVAMAFRPGWPALKSRR